MGAAKSWIEVAFATIFWGGGMLFWTTRKRKAANIKPACSYADALFWGFGGFEFGLLSTFRWQTFHRPLIYLVLLALAGALAVGRLNPAKASQHSPR